MLKAVLVVVLVASSIAGDDFDDGINFRILKKNYLNKDLAGGLRFGVGYGVSLESLDPDQISFKKYTGGRYMDIERSQLGKVDLKPYEEAFCDSDHEDDYDPNDGEVDEDCFPAIKGFISIESASCELAGRYVLGYKGASKRFNIIVRQCGSRYDWFEDDYWSDGETDMEFENFYNEEQNENETFLGVNEDNFMNNGIYGGFRVRVGAEDLDLEKLKMYKEGSESLPEGMSLDKKIYERTCDDQSDDSDDSDSDNDENKICRAAIYGFITASPAECSMDGDYYLEYDGKKVEFEVHVKSCGNDDWDEYESDYMYDSDMDD